MANNELAVRFTENKYATKSDVSRDLKMSIIDNIWSGILTYRSNFYRYLNLKGIQNVSFYICLCPTINDLIISTESRLFRLSRDFSKLNNNSLIILRDNRYVKILSNIAKKNKLSVSESFIRNIIHGEVKELDPENKILLQYLNVLKYIESRNSDAINIDYLAKLYEVFLGEELTSFYRTNEDNNPENRMIIDRRYTSAPVHLIEPMMNNLFTFIETSNISPVAKALTSFFFMSYIKPFDKFSDELSMLMAKAILAHFELDSFAVFLNLEAIMGKNIDVLNHIFLEVQKNNDITYFIDFALRTLSEENDDLADDISNINVQEIRDDFYKTDENLSVKSISPELEKQRLEEPVQDIEPPKPQKIMVSPTITPKSISNEQIAVSYIPPVLDERSASRLEQHLLELNPTMKKGEAHFYARHCTLGKMYTISQYKKFIGCVYETARTSMDHLVSLGYYRKQMVKNKNVYTPIQTK